MSGFLRDEDHAVCDVGQEVLGAAALGGGVQQVSRGGGVDLAGEGRQLHERGWPETGGRRERAGLDPSGVARRG